MSEETTDRVTHEKLAQALGAAFIEVDGYVQRTGEHQQGYKFASDADLIKAVRPAMAKHGLVILPSRVVATTREAGKTNAGADRFLTTTECSYILVHADSGEQMTLGMAGSGMGTHDTDKATYKAETGAYKYVLRQMFMLATGDDPETQGGADDHGPGGITEEELAEIKATEFKRGAAAGRRWVVQQQYDKDRDPGYSGQSFARALKEAGAGQMDDVRWFRCWQGRKKASQLDADQRADLIKWLLGERGQTEFAKFVEECGV